MYYKWIEWQEEAVTDGRILKLRKLRHQTKVDLCHVKYEIHRIHLWWSALLSEQIHLTSLYHAVDLELAELDGRLVRIADLGEQVKKENTKKQSLKSAVAKLSDEERLALIKELQNI